MSWLSRLGNVFRSSRVNQDLDDELRFHIQARADELVREGLAPEAAEAEARRQLGNALRLREESRDVKLLPWLESLIQDVRFGSRMLRKDAVVTGAAVVSLALAIGAATAAFALVDALVLRSLPVAEPERLVYVTFANDESEQPEGDGFNYPLFERMRNDGRAHVDLFGMGYATMRRAAFADAGGEEERVRTQYVSGNAFEILGVRAAQGRLLSAADDVTPDAHPVAVLSHAFWTRRFGANPAAVGQWFTFRERSIQIVGVAQPGFAGVEPGRLVDFWLPNMMWPRRAFTEPGWSWFRILGRLKPGADSAQARAILQSTFTQFRRERAQGFRADEPRERRERFLATPLMLRSARNGPSQLRRDFERPLWILATVVALVLLIAGSNVANLLLARAAAREREMSLRLAIGAGRGRLVQQVLIESGLLAGAACLLGLGFASVAGPAVVAMLAPSDSPAYLDLRLEARVVAFLGLVGALTAVLFGLAPALRASNVAPMGALKAGGSRLSSRRAVLRPLVALQVAFSLVVLFVGGLLSLSFRKLAAVDVGFDPAGLLLVDVESPDLREAESARRASLRLVEQLRRLPGIESASLSEFALFSGSRSTRSIRLPAREPDSFQPHYLDVSPGFFDTMGIRLLEGRDFRPSDTEPELPSAVVVNQAFARRYFGSEPALGRVFDRVERQGVARQEIVGVVTDACYDGDLRRLPPPTVYVPLRGLGTLQVRTALDPLALVSTLRQQISDVHPSLRVTGVNVQSTLIDNTRLRERLLALLSAFFAAVGLLLAAVGLYGVLSYAVVQRTKEIGIRLALGARPLAVVRRVLADTGLMTLIGIAGGLGGGLYLARFLATLLYEVRPLDPWSLALPIGALLAVAIAAALRPAWRAARVDPVVALRYE